MNNDYKNLNELITSLASNIEALENGKLSVYDLESLLNNARNVHERITILHYLAIETEVKVGGKEKQGIQFNFSAIEEVEETHPNQTNLIDAIQVEHHNEAVRKSIGTQAPLFQEEIKEEEAIPQSVIEPELESIIEPTVELTKEEISLPKENESKSSINDKFSGYAEKPTLADKLGQFPIEDLNKAIGLNQKFLFMNDLFEGENDKYKEVLTTINNFATYMEADEYINNSLKHQFEWDEESVSVQKFINLVKRRYL